MRRPFETNSMLVEDIVTEILRTEMFLPRHELYLEFIKRLRTKETGVSMSYSTFVAHLDELVRIKAIYTAAGEYSLSPL